jgi:hypothetical protein
MVIAALALIGLMLIVQGALALAALFRMLLLML